MAKKIGIIGAMAEEINFLQKDLKNAKKTTIANRAYFEGQLYGTEAVLVFSRWGKVASASTATTLIAKYRVDQIVFVGCAGAVDPRLKIGDIVIADQLIQHDLDPRPLFPLHTIPLLNISSIFPDPESVIKLIKAANTFINDNFQHVPATILNQFDIKIPKIYQGIIASGDQFISSPSVQEKLRQEIPNLLCVEMEGAAVGQVCFEHNIPFALFRTISDNADHHAAINFQAFIDQIVSCYTKGIIQHYLTCLRLNN